MPGECGPGSGGSKATATCTVTREVLMSDTKESVCTASVRIHAIARLNLNDRHQGLLPEASTLVKTLGEVPVTVWTLRRPVLGTREPAGPRRPQRNPVRGWTPLQARVLSKLG